MNNDLISRKQAIDALVNETIYTHEELVEYCEKLITGKDLWANGIYDSIEVIKQLPSAESKRGKWIDRGEHGDWEWQADGRGRHWHEWECNTCHHYFDERTFFCPHCGCDMRGEQYG